MSKTIFFLIVLTITSLPQTTSEEFDYDEGGNDWTGTCANGTVQSPIDILAADTVCDESQLFNLYFMHGSQTFTVIDTGETLQATTNLSSLYATASTGIFSGYQSLQFHFHAPSEHTIDGKHMDLEMHFVHSITSDFSSRGETKQTLAVVGIFFQEDENAEANPFIEAMDFANIGTKGGSRMIDLSEILLHQIPTPIQYFTYQGSLTTPPCTETVNWYVLATSLKIKRSELQLITGRYAGNPDFAHGNGNDRLVKPLNGRIVKRGGTPDCVGKHDGITISDWGITGIVVGSILFGATVAVLTFFFRKRVKGRDKKENSHQQTEPLIAANV